MNKKEIKKVIADKKVNNMKKKNYYARVKIEWSNFGIEAYNTHEAVKQLKAIFLEQYNIELADSEIVEIVVDELQGE